MLVLESAPVLRAPVAGLVLARALALLVGVGALAWRPRGAPGLRRVGALDDAARGPRGRVQAAVAPLRRELAREPRLQRVKARSRERRERERRET